LAKVRIDSIEAILKSSEVIIGTGSFRFAHHIGLPWRMAHFPADAAAPPSYRFAT
jgi:hypothetical protein